MKSISNVVTLSLVISIIVLIDNRVNSIKIKTTEPPVNKNLVFNSDGQFKILQFTDLHYGETDWKDYLSYNSQMGVLKYEQDADLVVMTGDSVSGYAWNGTEGWFASKWQHLISPMINNNKRWAFTLGNHDDQGDLNRQQIVQFDQTFPLSLTQQGPTSIHGATNYWLPIADQNGTVQTILYFFDSNDNNCQNVEGWGCVYPDQIEWYRATSEALQAKYGRVVPAIAFMHIPIPEYMDMWNFYPVNGSLFDTGVCCFSVNTGLFAAFKEMGDVISMHCGHDHDNNFIGYYNGIQLGYGAKSGYGGYGPPVGWKHGARILEITANPFSINTYLRFDDGTTDMNQVPHAPLATEQYNTCCDTYGFVNITGNSYSQCKLYELNFDPIKKH
ncbi:hypothetical protein DLAC_11463 [Tieghemostelium lacteum]|uniref:Calcineurin-like phosphoesterase domain-containing protein n=1 Tax=Tieghemostelium lacteum TaxID=361077 RepID=A0A152A7Y8_TIELA|nr:hypothetical protein DLAC_11463 [Tieghemostelium lacteum]|eukprot:KYR02318.1 hypothetical protein DLAC_11463 [Tieghemostelium lacteum]